MADKGGGDAALGVVLGGLLVFVILMLANGWGSREQRTASLNIEAPKIVAPEKPIIIRPDAR